jgi:hypothetical protein
VETEQCPHCRQEIPEEEWERHEAGLDVKRLACPHQDLDEIAEAGNEGWIPGVQLPAKW